MINLEYLDLKNVTVYHHYLLFRGGFYMDEDQFLKALIQDLQKEVRHYQEKEAIGQ